MDNPKKEGDIAESIRKKLEEHKKQQAVKSYSNQGTYPRYKPLLQKPKEVRTAQEISPGRQLSPKFQANKEELPTGLLKEPAQAALLCREEPRSPGALAEKPPKKSRLILIILIIAVLLMIALLLIYLVFFLYLPSERELNSTGNIEKAVVLKSGEVSVRLAEEADLDHILKVQIIFSAGDAEYLYNPEYISSEYKIYASDLGLKNFDEITLVKAVFLYKQEEPNDTIIYPFPVNQSTNQTNQTAKRNTTFGGGGGGGVGDSVCTPNCAGKDCGDNGCGVSCGSCASGYSCMSGRCLFIGGLVSYWKFDGNANDAMGINNGTVHGDPKVVDGIEGKAYEFNGFEDYIEVGNDSSLDITGDITISVWIKWNGGPTAQIFKRGRYQEEGYSLYVYNNGEVYFWTSQPGASQHAISERILPNNWYNIVFKRNGQTGTLYINGFNKTNVSTNFLDAVSSNRNAIIGADPELSALFFNGTIDELKIWNYTLSEEEIMKEYKNYTEKLVSYWKFDGNADDSIVGNNGTVNGATLAQGISGQAYNFDGVNDYINISDSSSLHVDNFTIAAWVKIANNSQTGGILSDDSTGLNTQWELFIRGESGGKGALFYGPDETLITSTTTFENDSWYYLLAAYDGLNIYIYVNGILENSSIVINGPNYSLSRTPGIGIINSNWTSGNFFNGTIDEVKIWNYALSAEEIHGIYESQKPTIPAVPTRSPFVSFWEFISKFLNQIFHGSISEVFSLR